MVHNVKLVRSDLVLDAAGIVSLAGSIQLQGRKLDKDIQIALASAAIHAHQHGQVTPLNTVLEKLPTGMRTNAAKAYIEAFAPVRWHKKNKAFTLDSEKMKADILEESASDEIKIFLIDLLETEWLGFKPEPDFKPKDSEEMTAQFIKRLTSAMGEDDRNSIAAEDIAALHAALDAIKVNKIRRAAVAAGLLQAEEQAEQAEA